MEEKRVRIADIAGELGLSTATVSNVLHGKTKKISDETVKRVQALLEERQYVPSMAGILLAQNSSRIIGIMINDHEKYEGRALEDSYIASSLNYLSAEIEKSGQFMMIKKTCDVGEIIKFSSMWNMDGVVIMGFCAQDYSYLRERMHIPFVVYDGYCHDAKRICNISIDNYGGGFQVGEHFKHLGHRRALCIADNCECMDKERFEGFRAGFGEDGSAFMLIPNKKELRQAFYMEKLRELRSYSAVFAVSDFYAAELIQFLRDNQVSVPGEVSVAGFDNAPISTLISPALTTVSQNLSLKARTAIEKLRELKAGEDVSTEIVLPVTLIERSSTGKPNRE